MSLYFSVLTIGFIFSFIGSIPPGSININVLQHSLKGDFKAALRFALAAALIEYPYAYLAVSFGTWVSSSPHIIKNFHLIAAVVMLGLGVSNLWHAHRPPKIPRSWDKSGFRKGVLISLLNPSVLPFWVGVTAYVRSLGLASLDSPSTVSVYVLGISLGTFTLLYSLAVLGKKIAFLFLKKSLLQLLPGVAFILLGLYSLYLSFHA